MSAKKKQLKTTIKDLHAELDRAKHTAQRSRSKADHLKKANAELQAQVKHLKKSNKRLAKPSPPAEQRQPVTRHEPAAMSAESPGSNPVATPAVAGPDGSWTVARLREEARACGLTGLSRMTKAELLAALG